MPWPNTIFSMISCERSNPEAAASRSPVWTRSVARFMCRSAMFRIYSSRGTSSTASFARLIASPKRVSAVSYSPVLISAFASFMYPCASRCSMAGLLLCSTSCSRILLDFLWEMMASSNLCSSYRATACLEKKMESFTCRELSSAPGSSSLRRLTASSHSWSDSPAFPRWQMYPALPWMTSISSTSIPGSGKVSESFWSTFIARSNIMSAPDASLI